MQAEQPYLPLVSIVTIAYNSAETIWDTLHSVAIQSYPNIEHIIIDGASKDNTLDIVRQFPHVKKIVSEPDKGLYDAMNKGILASVGEIVSILNSDDFYISKDVVSQVVEQMTRAIGCIICRSCFCKPEKDCRSLSHLACRSILS